MQCCFESAPGGLLRFIPSFQVQFERNSYSLNSTRPKNCVMNAGTGPEFEEKFVLKNIEYIVCFASCAMHLIFNSIIQVRSQLTIS